MRYMRTGLLAMAMLSAGIIGCRRQGTSEAPAPASAAQSDVVRLVVDNENFFDFDVFVVSDGGLRTRIGTASGSSTSDYKLRSDLWGPGTVRLIATPIGGFGVARSDPLTVFGGNTVKFTIQPDLRASFATVR